MKKKLKSKTITSRRKAVDSDASHSVEVQPLLDGVPIPCEIRPEVDGTKLSAWARANRAYVDELLRTHRALLFRGFAPCDLDEFQQFVLATSDGNLLEYRDRTTPRTTKAERVYSSTEHPPDQRINPHNEGTYWLRWPMKLYFCCLTAPMTGGQTPISDVRRVYDHIDPGIRQKFVDKKMMLVRNFGEGLGLSWQSGFQTESREEVGSFCQANEIDFEWRDADHLTTRSIRPAVRYHPATGEPVWFNHAAFYHYTTLEPAIREILLNDYGQEGLPFNTYYGDGEPIEPEVAEHLRAAYAKEQRMFDWAPGDVTLLDNMTISHAREPFTGKRDVVVAMTDVVDGDACKENVHS